MVLARDWTSTRGHRTLDYDMYACFMQMHVDASVNARFVDRNWTSTTCH